MEFTDDSTGFQRSGIVPCDCKEKVRMDYINSTIPTRYRDADLATLGPMTLKHLKQPKVIDFIKANPFESYLFLGRNGVGKTYFSYAIWKNAAKHGRRVVAGTMAEFNAEFRQLELSNNADFRPRVVAEDLKQDHTPYTILIDEIEKVRVTPFSVEKMFDLVKAAADFNHQLIVTTNETREGLVGCFSTIDNVWGNSILTRLTAKARVVEMF